LDLVPWYAYGCTSGHAIMGLSSLQLPSLIASHSLFYGRWFYHGQSYITSYFKIDMIMQDSDVLTPEEIIEENLDHEVRSLDTARIMRVISNSHEE
ncbi:MAG: hypothetical protein IPF70_12985, partial [Saprospiraceae bacterium]|nr:hypothetical protein [Saprospiraceae bacterium]